MTDRFDAELEAALARPGMTYSMAEKLKKYPAWARAKWTTHAHQTAERLRSDAAGRVDELVPTLDTARDELGRIEKALDDGSMTAVEAVEALNAVRGRVQTAERGYDAACANDARAETIHEDPVGYVERIFNTYPSLNDRRITLHDYLAEIDSKINPLDRGVLRNL